jgi:glyoxylase I family protein
MVIGLHHVSLLVADTARALIVYRDILGLMPVPRPDLGFPGAWLQAGEQQIHLLELPNPDPTDARPAHGGRDRHVAFAVDDLDAVTERLEAAGIPYTRSRSGRRAIFCRDPDGNAVELVARDEEE